MFKVFRILLVVCAAQLLADASMSSVESYSRGVKDWPSFCSVNLHDTTARLEKCEATLTSRDASVDTMNYLVRDLLLNVTSCEDDLVKYKTAFVIKEKEVNDLTTNVVSLTEQLNRLESLLANVTLQKESFAARLHIVEREMWAVLSICIVVCVMAFSYRFWFSMAVLLARGVFFVLKLVFVVVLFDGTAYLIRRVCHAYNYARTTMFRDLRVAFDKRFKRVVRNEDIILTGLENCDEESRGLLSDPIQSPIVKARPQLATSGSSEIIFSQVERYTAEAILSYSPLIDVKKHPKCIVKIYSISDEDGSRLTALGLGFWAGKYLITASHLLRVANTREVAVFNANDMTCRVDMKVEDFCRLDEIDVAAIKLTPAITSKLKISKAKVPAHSLVSKVTTQVYGLTHTSNGYIKRQDANLGHLWFDGSSKCGFSGSPYMVGDTLVYGMHHGSSQVLGFGIEIALVMSALEHYEKINDVNYITMEASEDFLLDEIARSKGRDVEYSQGVDEYIIRFRDKYYYLDNEYVNNHPTVGKYLTGGSKRLFKEDQHGVLEHFVDIDEVSEQVQGNSNCQPGVAPETGNSIPVSDAQKDSLLELIEQKFLSFQKQLDARLAGQALMPVQPSVASNGTSKSSKKQLLPSSNRPSRKQTEFEKRLSRHLMENGLILQKKT
nr:hypothetical protein [Solemoviridae sp.]